MEGLRRAVRERCESIFLETVGRPWDVFAAQYPKPDPKARIWRKLRDAMSSATEIAAQRMHERDLPQDIAKWVNAHVAALVEPLETQLARFGVAGPRKDRSRLVAELDDTPFFTLDRTGTDHELAIVSLLAGNFPAVSRQRLPTLTVGKVIDDEVKAIRKARDRFRDRRATRALASPAGARMLLRRIKDSGVTGDTTAREAGAIGRKLLRDDKRRGRSRP